MQMLARGVPPHAHVVLCWGFKHHFQRLPCFFVGILSSQAKNEETAVQDLLFFFDLPPATNNQPSQNIGKMFTPFSLSSDGLLDFCFSPFHCDRLQPQSAIVAEVEHKNEQGAVNFRVWNLNNQALIKNVDFCCLFFCYLFVVYCLLIWTGGLFIKKNHTTILKRHPFGTF